MKSVILLNCTSKLIWTWHIPCVTLQPFQFLHLSTYLFIKFFLFTMFDTKLVIPLTEDDKERAENRMKEEKHLVSWTELKFNDCRLFLETRWRDFSFKTSRKLIDGISLRLIKNSKKQNYKNLKLRQTHSNTLSWYDWCKINSFLPVEKVFWQ